MKGEVEAKKLMDHFVVVLCSCIFSRINNIEDKRETGNER
jgi:hypothetical protein